MPRKPAHQQIDTLKGIQDCAFELFARYGYDGVSIGGIARAVMSLGEAVILPLRHQSPDEVRQTLGVLARTLFLAYARQAPLPQM